jgi:hypothetical protein
LPDGQHDVYVEDMNGQRQYSQLSTRADREIPNFIGIVSLQMRLLKHLPENHLIPSKPYLPGRPTHVCV